ncbi:hypothetical protein [Candidatus Ichthyocystis hellenicum]|uniref:hypothetical protein n=1 Tax=Candidatus Ichthyocystis hellenicum TaxID=1561003 RepID=UPI001111C4E4|nr:hypothetical protein [Candidatus Ichthyocystis hellenicum]
MTLLGSVSCSFSRAVYDIRPSIIFHLRNEMMSPILDAVSELSILDESGESIITYVDREHLFL